MDVLYLQSLTLMAIDCVIFNDKLAGTTSINTRNVLINKYKIYFSKIIFTNEDYYFVLESVSCMIDNLVKLDLYSPHIFLILQCKKAWLVTNEHIKITH